MFKSLMIELGKGTVQGKNCSVLRLKDKRFVLQEGYLVLMQVFNKTIEASELYLSNARHEPYGAFTYGSKNFDLDEATEIVSQQFLIDNFLQAMNEYVAAKAVAALTSNNEQNEDDGGNSAA